LQKVTEFAREWQFAKHSIQLAGANRQNSKADIRKRGIQQERGYGAGAGPRARGSAQGTGEQRLPGNSKIRQTERAATGDKRKTRRAPNSKAGKPGSQGAAKPIQGKERGARDAKSEPKEIEIENRRDWQAGADFAKKREYDNSQSSQPNSQSGRRTEAIARATRLPVKRQRRHGGALAIGRGKRRISVAARNPAQHLRSDVGDQPAGELRQRTGGGRIRRGEERGQVESGEPGKSGSGQTNSGKGTRRERAE